ncbi:hypothetical protein NJ76_12160 [Rhodococcus sp. IITR03]|nr:hypothetical protein NJ76_12160 [Rhodococcus sp. IITR03]
MGEELDSAVAAAAQATGRLSLRFLQVSGPSSCGTAAHGSDLQSAASSLQTTLHRRCAWP